MNKLLKRLLSALLAAAIVCTSAGCSKKTGTSAGQSDDVQSVDQDVESGSEENVDTTYARVTVEGTKFMVGGKELWINGTNTPWEKWNDFTVAMDEEFWDKEFAQLVADGVNCTRIWVNCNGENIVKLGDDGKITYVNPAHWEALDKLFALAEKHKLYIMPTLLSFDHFKEPVNGRR